MLVNFVTFMKYFSDYWDLDLCVPLNAKLQKLDFMLQLGAQHERGRPLPASLR